MDATIVEEMILFIMVKFEIRHMPNIPAARDGVKGTPPLSSALELNTYE